MLGRLILRLCEAMTHDRAEGGQGMVEYALTLVLIAVVVVVIVGVVGRNVSNTYNNVAKGFGP